MTDPFTHHALEHDGERLPYSVRLPPESVPRPRPGLLFLHGMGESGTDGRAALGVGLPPELCRHPERWPHVVVVPQKPERHREWIAHRGAVLRAFDLACETHDVDRQRVHLTGLSQGGAGCWHLAEAEPDRWASVSPVCGFAQPPRQGWALLRSVADWEAEPNGERVAAIAAALRHVPVWAFHGTRDPLVPARFSMEIVRALEQLDAPARLTLLQGVGHESWEHAYADPELPRWMARAERAAR